MTQDCAEKGVKGLLLFTSGFKEKDEEGRKIELEMAQIARQGGVRIIGPNANGFYCPASRICTFPGALIVGGLPLETGDLAVFSRAAHLPITPARFGRKNIRFSKVIGYGNESDLSAADFLEYFGQDEETKIFAGYIEGVKDGRGFFELAKRISKQKPIILWKGGLTETGARAAQAHTGALAGSGRSGKPCSNRRALSALTAWKKWRSCIGFLPAAFAQRPQSSNIIRYGRHECRYRG